MIQKMQGLELELGIVSFYVNLVVEVLDDFI